MSKGGRVWPLEARYPVTVRLTAEQWEAWHAAKSLAACSHLGVWVAIAADFYAWYTKRHVYLVEEREEQLKCEAREKVRELSAGGERCREPE